ncbi:hypothetical protein PSN45_003015 [Yamadazyma tenuis]|nr:hypothetical protein PSN45_003015 [Yamadazyma tenuis]
MKFKRADVKHEHYAKHFQPNGFKRKSRTKVNTVTTPSPPISESSALNWLFEESSFENNQIQLINSTIFDNQANSMLMELLGSNLDQFPSVLINFSAVSPELLALYVDAIPQLVQHPDFISSSLEYCLTVYWEIFHVQFPILHKPSFNTLAVSPLLTLSMIMMGAVLSYSSQTASPLIDASGLSLLIGSELRWLIFRHRRPNKSDPWELQSLLILEVYEKHYANRDLHERSSIHQAAKIEMMKRSTLLGGDPYSSESMSSAELKQAQNEVLLAKWVAAESMKRCLLMSFVFDLTSSIISSHCSSLFVDKLKLSLPCDDIIWEADLSTLKNIALPQKPPSIRSCFNKLLQGEKIEASSFGNKVLFHAITSLIIQLEQRDDTLSLINGLKPDILNDNWRLKISFALDSWKFNINQGSCCNIDSLLIDLRVRNKPTTKYFELNEPRCKMPVYHMAHIRLHIINHDLLIYAGVPARMNVVANKQDYDNVAERMVKWANSVNGRMGVIHAYLCLFECLLPVDQGDIDYKPATDPIPERPHVIVDSCLTIWGYNFVLWGPESDRYNSGELAFKESGSEYLSRMKSILGTALAENNAQDFYLSVKRLAKSLLTVPNTRNLAGFMNEMSRIYSQCFWTLGQEYSRLFASCAERSMGRGEVFCANMYKESIV